MEFQGMLKLRFTTNPHSLVSLGIRLMTWSEFSHVEFVIPGQGYLGAHIDGGVLIRPFDYDPQCKQEFGFVVCPSRKIEEAILKFAHDQLRKPYDLSGVIGIALHRDWKKPESWFCSELVAGAFAAAGNPLFNEKEPLNRVTPSDIYHSSRVHLGYNLR